jgi:hypothetical protein
MLAVVCSSVLDGAEADVAAVLRAIEMDAARHVVGAAAPA